MELDRPGKLLKCQKILMYVKKHANQGDVMSVVATVDRYEDEVEKTIHIGSKKGKIVDSVVQDTNPTNCLELGTFFGYSALRIARLLGPGAKLYTIERDPDAAKFASQLIEFAGMSAQVILLYGKSSDVITRFCDGEFSVFLFSWIT